MPITKAEILARAEQLAAGIGGDAHASPVIDAGMTAETILPHVWHFVVTRAARDPKKQHLFRQTKDLNFVNGVADLPEDVLSETLPVATLHDPADLELRVKMSWCPYWFDFTRSLRTMLGYYTINEAGKLAIRRPGEAWEDGAGFSGQIKLTIPCVPGLVDPINVPDEVVDEVVAGVAGVLRGEEMWKKLIGEMI